MHQDFLAQGPALILENRLRVMATADLHFGVESGLARHGVHIPSNSSGRLERMIACIEESDPDLLILLGDIKHGVPLTSRQEYREIPTIFREIRKRVDLRVVPGNHDGGIERFLQDEELLPVGGCVIDGVGYLHGHTYPDPALRGHLIVCGHHHPVVYLYDEVGCALRARPAYLLAELDDSCIPAAPPEASPATTRALFMPAFSELAGGIDLRKITDSKLSPLSRCIKIEGAEVFLDDGTYISSLAALLAEQDPRAARRSDL
jgi:putative SbcD/Mre11-related phosphoesterase